MAFSQLYMILQPIRKGLSFPGAYAHGSKDSLTTLFVPFEGLTPENLDTLIYQITVTARDCVPVGKVASNIDLLPACLEERLSAIVRYAEFRSVDTFQEQVITNVVHSPDALRGNGEPGTLSACSARSWRTC